MGTALHGLANACFMEIGTVAMVGAFVAKRGDDKLFCVLLFLFCAAMVADCIHQASRSPFPPSPNS